MSTLAYYIVRMKHSKWYSSMDIAHTSRVIVVMEEKEVINQETMESTGQLEYRHI